MGNHMGTKTVDNPPAGERARLSAVLRLEKIHIVGGGGLEKNWAKNVSGTERRGGCY